MDPTAHVSNNEIGITRKEEMEEAGMDISKEAEIANTLTFSQFKEAIEPKYGSTAWDDKVWPKMKNIVYQTTKAVQDVHDHPKN